MQVLFITDNFPPERNAPASRVYEQACYWVRWGHQVTVLTCAPNFPEGKVYEGYRNRWYQVDVMDGIRVVRVKTFIAANAGVGLRTLDFLSFMIMAFFVGLFQTRPDVVVATSPQFMAVVGGYLLAAVRGLPFVFELRDLWPASIEAVGAVRDSVLLRRLEQLELFLYHGSTKVVALSPAFKDNLVKRGVSPDHVAVVISGVDMGRYSPRPADPVLIEELGLRDCFVVGYLGTHGMAHALDRVLEAAELLRDSPAVRFLFIGAGAARDSLIAEASRRRLTNVIFLPAQAKDKMPAYWSICDVALVHLKNAPLFATVIPSKIFEAMGMGKAILLAAPAGEATRIVAGAGAGVIVPPEEPAQLASAVRRLCEDRALVKQLAANALAAAFQYSREKQAREMLEVLQAAVRRHVQPVESAWHHKA